jgi:hypothetical protein
VVPTDADSAIFRAGCEKTRTRLQADCTFHNVSIKHLGRYCNAFSYRFNRRGEQLQRLGRRLRQELFHSGSVSQRKPLKLSGLLSPLTECRVDRNLGVLAQGYSILILDNLESVGIHQQVHVAVMDSQDQVLHCCVAF